MRQLESIVENKIINELIAQFRQSPARVNQPHESDAEIISLDESNELKLAITTDSIVEEIHSRLYDDPYLIGWMIVTVNMSDLAAVGAAPLGILISEIFPENFDKVTSAELQKGIADACNHYKTFVLGGDTNTGTELILSGCAVGIIKSGKNISRIGCKPGNLLYSTGKLGAGNAYACQKLLSFKDGVLFYKPSARLEEGKLIRTYATSCIDSSDGFISSIDQLMRLNNVGFKINNNWEMAIDDKSKIFALENEIPVWLLLAGQHGEFELIFTIPQESEPEFLEEAVKIDFSPVKLGKVTHEKLIRLSIYDELQTLNTAMIRNLSYESKNDTNLYLTKLLDYDSELRAHSLVH